MKIQRKPVRKILLGLLSAQIAFCLAPSAFAQSIKVTPVSPASAAISTATYHHYSNPNNNFFANGAGRTSLRQPSLLTSLAAIKTPSMASLLQLTRTANTLTLINPSTLNGLTVKSGKIEIIDLSNPLATNIILTGNLTNAGTIYVVSSNPLITHVSISAANVDDLQGALFSTVLPASGLLGFSALVPNLSLSLSAINNIVNSGTISSAGALSLSAGHSIVNQLPTGVTGTGPTIMAMQNLNLQSPSISNSGIIASQLGSLSANTANLVNSGTVQARAGQINIQNLIGNVLNVNNLHGTIAAGQSLNFSTLGSLYDSQNKLLSQGLLTIEGGNLQAPQLFLTSPGGQINVAVEQVSGGVNLTGASAVVNASDSGLKIDNASLTGDPIFTANGTLDLSGLFVSGPQFSTNGADFIALSTGDIIAPTAPVGANIYAGSLCKAGGQIFIDAGTNFTVANAGCSNCTNTDYTIGSPSATGGSVVLPGISLATNSNNVTVIANSNCCNSTSGNIQIGNINTSGAGAPALVLSGGGTSLCQAPSGQSAGNITITADKNISTGYLRATGGGGAGGYADGAGGGNGGKGGTIAVTAHEGTIDILGDVNSSGGGGGGGAGGAPQYVRAPGGNGGSAGQITLNAAADVSITGPVLAVGGGGGDGAPNDSVGTPTNPLTSGLFDRNGGGSLGYGGGAGGDSGAGGGALNGGGGSVNYASGGGGGIFGPGAADNVTAGGSNASPGTIGLGGTGFQRLNDPLITSVPGSVYGVNGDNGSAQINAAGVAGQGGRGPLAGSAGASNAIEISGQNINISGTVASYYGSAFPCSASNFSSSPFAGVSVMGGTVNINSRSKTSLQYGTDGNLSSTTADVNAIIYPAQFTVGTDYNGTNGALGGVYYTGSSQINGTNLPAATTLPPSSDAVGGVTSGNYGSSVGQLSINAGGTALTISNGSSVTPAEFIAQTESSFGSQSLLLNTVGQATGGYFSIAPANLPTNGFSTLLIPNNVTAAVVASSPAGITVSASGKITNNGILQLSGNTVFESLNFRNNGFIDRLCSGNTLIVANAPDSACSTCGNSQGSVNLGDKSIITNGGDFVVLASGDISGGGDATINASNSDGCGGQIILAAGTNLSGEGPYNISAALQSGASNSGGNILMPTVNLLTNSNNVLLQAHYSNVCCPNSGNVQIGNVNTSGAGAQALVLTGAVCGSEGNYAPAGQNAGNISILADNNASSGYLRATGGGGAGGYANGGGGGNGGNGGNIVVNANAGAIAISGDVNSSGGGGGGGAGGSSPRYGGGAGGNAGKITIAAGSDVSIVGPVLAVGGGGGDGAPTDSYTNGLFDRNGGGSLGYGGGAGGDSGAGGGALNGGGGSVNYGSGGGGGIFGPGLADNVSAGGSVATPGTIGLGGTGSQRINNPGLGPIAGGVYGVSGDNGAAAINAAGVAGQSGRGCLPGVAGTGGAIKISGQNVNISGTVASYYGSAFPGSANNFSSSPFAAVSVMGGTVDISSRSKTSLQYGSDGNLSSTADDVSAIIYPAQFTVGSSYNGVNGAAGGVYYNGTSQINGTVLAVATVLPPSSIPVGGISSGVYGSPVGHLTISAGASTLSISNGADVTPAEWIALTESSFANQTLQLNAVGQAVGGSFTIAQANLPSNGFSSLLIPINVTGKMLGPIGNPANQLNVVVNGATDVLGTLAIAGEVTINTQSYYVRPHGGVVDVLSCGNLTLNVTPPVPPVPPTPQHQNSNSSGGANSLVAVSPTTVIAQNRSLLVGTVELPLVTVVGNQCIAYTLHTAPDSYLQSTQGTKIAVSGPNAVAISDGQAVVKAGSDQLTVQSNGAMVVLQAEAIAVISSKPGELMTVTSLSDANPDGVDIKVDSQSYHIKPGEQLLIGKVSNSNLNAGLNQSPLLLQGNVAKQNPVYVMKAAVELSEYLPKMGLVQQCRDCAFANYIANKTTQEPAQYAGSHEGAMLPKDNNGNAAVEQSQLKSEFSPVAYTAGILPRNIVTSGNAELVSIAADHFRLNRGNALIQVKRPIRIDTEQVSVYARPGAILLLTDSRQLSRVRELSDKHTGDVKVVVGNETLALSPGKEIAVTRQEADPIPSVLADGLARRNIKVEKIGKLQVVSDEFSILNALMNHPLLYQLRQSKNDALDTKTLAQISKVAAALSLVSDRYKGPYFAPEVKTGTGIAEKPVDPMF